MDNYDRNETELKVLTDKLKRILEASFFVRLVNAVAAFLERQWDKSFAASAIAGARERSGEPSVLNSIESGLNRAWTGAFRALRLDRLFEGSIFTRSFFWLALTALIAPIAPTTVTLLSALAAFFSLLVNLGRGELRLRYLPINKWIYAYALVYLICTLTSVNVSSNIKGGALSLVFILFPIVLVNVVRKKRGADILTAVLVISGFAVAAIGILQLLRGATSTTKWIDESFNEDISLRVYSTLDNPNVLSEYLLLIIPLGAAMTLTAGTVNGRIASGVATAAMIAAMILTYSRGGWLGLILSVVVFLVIMDVRFIPIGLICAVILFFFLPDTILSRFQSIGNLSDTSTNYRVSIWIGTVAMLKDYWLTGVGTGIEAFRNIYPVYSQHSALAQHSHSLYLQILAEMGISGGIVFLGVIFCTVRQCASRIRRGADRTLKIRLAAILSGLAGFMLQSGTDYSFYNYRVMLVFWMVIGLGAVLARLPEESGKDGAE